MIDFYVEFEMDHDIDFENEADIKFNIDHCIDQPGLGRTGILSHLAFHNIV